MQGLGFRDRDIQGGSLRDRDVQGLGLISKFCVTLST